MLRLNLVSQELKKEIKLRHIYEAVKRINCVLVIITVFVAVVILSAKVILQNSFNEVTEQTTLVTKNSQSYNTKVRVINDKIKSVAQIQNDFLVWSNVLNDIYKIGGKNISFSSIKIKIGSELSLKGVAENRDDLLAFKDNLEKSDFFSNIKLPLKNMLDKENLSFEITADLEIGGVKK